MFTKRNLTDKIKTYRYWCQKGLGGILKKKKNYNQADLPILLCFLVMVYRIISLSKSFENLNK